MKIDAAKDLLETVFASSYSRDNFKRLAAEVFNGYVRKEQAIYQEESVKSFTNLGLFEDDKGKKIAVIEVELLSENSLHRARVTQRNLIANQLKIHDYDSALCSFYHGNQGEWRLSFVTRESSIDANSEKLKFIEQLSPSRRQSFIAGPNEGTHTAKKQFLPRIQSDNKPSFDEIVSIFEIEAVNDDFYEQYKELYLRLTKELEQFMEKDPVIAADFKEKEVSASDFAKKTLGQFIFLYFLQRKGWIKDKVHLDEEFSFSKLFDDRKRFGGNFFNDLMEPIFYESLAKKEPNLEDYSVLHHYEFPYLNGGLFEPIRNYDWEKTNIVISDTFFKNDNRTKDGDIGDGLLDVFNRFNFTVHENDSLDQDIAVDPEMLGKVFENLLEESVRKKNGAFYTPRFVVQFICQESLINYLVTEIGDEISSEAIKLFITNHTILEAKNIKGAELEIIAENAMVLDQLLANVKVCDPAVGSGAFPMGMLREIVSARYSLQPFLPNEQTVYDLKLHTIGQSLYGVDLDPSAVDIARLRFWLSLIIEEDTPIPLPNLEHKLMQGNSLLSSYEGVELFNDQFLVNGDSRQEKLKILDGEIKTYEDELKNGVNTNDIQRVRAIKKHLIRLGKQKNKIQAEITTIPRTQTLFESDDALSRINKQVDLLQSKIKQFLLLDENSNKEDLKNEIENIKWNLIEASVDSERKAKAFQQLKNKRIQPFFLWRLEFIDIFRNNNGFDIVIGNPPYVRQESIESDLKKSLIKKYPETGSGTADLYIYFFDLGLSILNKNGVLGFITLNKFLKTLYGAGLRKKIQSDVNIEKVVDFFELPLFDAATDVAITLLCKSKIKNISKYYPIKSLENLNLFEFCKNNYRNITYTKDEWIFLATKQLELYNKLIFDSKPLKDIVDGNIYRGITTGKNEAFILNNDIGSKLNSSESSPLIKKYAIPTQINKWRIDKEKNESFFLATGFDINVKKEFPSAYTHLEKYEEDLRLRQDKGKNWWNLRPCKYYDKFKLPKIIYIHTSKNQKFYFDTEGHFINNSCYMIVTSNSFIRCFLNSNLFRWYKNTRFVAYGDGEIGGRTKLDYNKMKDIPIRNIKQNDIIFFNEKISKIEKLIKENNSDNPSLIEQQEFEINKYIYNLYELDDHEIKMIERGI